MADLFCFMKRSSAMKNLDIQRKIVANMTSESWRSIPHVVFSYEPDITAFEKRWRSAGKTVSFNTLMLSTIACALKAAPKMNAHFSFNRWLVTGHLDVKESVDISMPTVLPDGRMMTLNIHGCGSKTPEELQACINDALRRAAASSLDDAMMDTAMKNTYNALWHGKVITALGRLIGKTLHPECAKTLKGKARRQYRALPTTERLGTEDIEQGTITVSNFGSLYKSLRGRPMLLEVVPPQVVAIGIGAIQNENDRRILPMCIAFDHRVLDFGDIVPFIKKMDELLG